MKAAGLRVVIVSDTYLEEAQLRELLRATLPKDAYAAIDQVFCSSAFGYSKREGLFLRVLERLQVRPAQVLHVGDNRAADYLAARSAGIHAVHLVQHDARATEVIRLGHIAQQLCLPKVRDTAPLESPFRGVLARDSGPDTPAHVLGALGLGPLLYSFARFVLDEVAALERDGQPVKPVFLMRDGYLPQLACEALAGAPYGHAISISRFVAYASTFRTPTDVQDYLASFAGSGRLEDLSKQLLLPQVLSATLIEKSRRSKRVGLEFVRLVQEKSILETIIARSKAFRTRLFRYLFSQVGVSKGDTLLFVDLGYEGTAQRLLEPLFRDELGVTIMGRYLLAVGVPGWERSRRGLIDPSLCDDRTLVTLATNISLLEVLCTSGRQSVVDYTESGEPICADQLIDKTQTERVQPVQQESLDFVRAAVQFFTETGKPPSPDALRAAALGALGRLLFLPTEPEIAYLEPFQLDMNLATTDVFPLFDRSKGLVGLRRRGMWFMERNMNRLRTNYPFELRSVGIELSLTALVQQRFGLEIMHSDATLRSEQLPILVTRGKDIFPSTARAKATHDGYFALDVPLGANGLSLGVLFGNKYQWLQIDSVELIQTSALYGDQESDHTEDASASVSLDGIVQRAPGLFECQSAAGFLFVAGSDLKGPDDSGIVCRIVFRPLVLRIET